MPAAIAAFVIALLYGGAAGVLALRGKQKVKEGTPPVPEQAMESVKDDIQSVKEDIRWARNRKPSATR